jgi:hypothetical protein
MRFASLSALSFCLILQACTESQDLGDHPNGDGDGDGDVSHDPSQTSGGDGDHEVPDQPEDGEVNGGDGDSVAILERGSFESFTPQTLAFGRVNSDLGVAAVSEGGPLGCALGSDEDGAPGGEASLVLVRLNTSANPDVCPEGAYAIRNKDYCNHPYIFGLTPGCGVFRRWNDDGEMTDEVLATGGAVQITRTGDHCIVEMQVAFPGGKKLEKAYDFTFDEGGAQDAFCVH